MTGGGLATPAGGRGDCLTIISTMLDEAMPRRQEDLRWILGGAGPTPLIRDQLFLVIGSAVQRPERAGRCIPQGRRKSL